MEASKREFLNNIEPMPADYVRLSGNEKAILVSGPYVVELYKNISSRYRQRKEGDRKGAIYIREKVGEKSYKSVADNVFSGEDGLSLAKMRFNKIRDNPSSRIEEFIQEFGN